MIVLRYLWHFLCFAWYPTVVVELPMSKFFDEVTEDWIREGPRESVPVPTHTREWLDNNLPFRWQFHGFPVGPGGYRFAFYRPADATLFKLTWG